MKKKLKINLISLGCHKNLVDSEVILGRLAERGFIPTPSSRAADVIIINTCSFIKEARKESYQVIARIISKKSLLSSLLASLEEIKDLLWIRLLYTHPSHFSSSLLKNIRLFRKRTTRRALSPS